ncbi:MAG TPA: sulfur carrier protein ThiS adenylyltransferase ThiF [Bacteroidales bacterium]|nr:sulfur carrier protein ThiS adenylyltransferase ThiF [Bacteroidales bacterium]
MRFGEIKKHLSKFTVGIAGAGGLGSNCAAALARSGIGSLVIADFDYVEEANLNRQFYFANQVGMHKTDALKENLLRINPDLRLVMHNIELNRDNIPGLFEGCDVMVEAFDRADFKEFLVETVQIKMPGVPLVVGSGMAGWGNSEIIKARKIDDKLYICGDETTQVSEDNPPMAPRVGIVSNMQANFVIEILMKK